MQGRGGVCVSAKVAAQPNWLEPIRDGQSSHRRFVWIKKCSGGQNGSGPTGHKATPRALLARTLAERPGVSAVVTTRQAATVARKALPLRVIYGPL